MQKFHEIIKKEWGKSTIDDNAKIYPGAGERQSRRLKAQKQLTEEDQNPPLQVSKPQKKQYQKSKMESPKACVSHLPTKQHLKTLHGNK